MQNFEDAPPPADALVESLRGFGYSTETAVADIVDNSITAQAKNVRIQVELAASTPFISILDDGEGMDLQSLRNAMKLGSQNPLIAREETDLGRFGLGLKTASFSQARSLTVASKQRGCEINIRRWDLDFLAESDGEWRLLTSAPDGTEKHIQSLESQPCGTLVLWQKLDRIRPRLGGKKDGFKSQILMEQIEHHLAMVFQRYLEGTRPRIRLFVNEANIKPWDPFLSNHAGCQTTPEEIIVSGDARIRVKGYVLPNKDMFDAQNDYDLAGGSEGWVTNQGFYIYRNDRLLVAGGWLGLGMTKPWVRDEAHKLARIRIDLPNSEDVSWQIDVKKSDASPPDNVRTRLRDLALSVRQQARSVFVHRGKYGKRPAVVDLARPWKAVRIADQSAYRIERSHPIASYILSELDDDSRSIASFFKLLENTVPIEKIWIDTVEQGELPATPFSGDSREQIRKLARDLLASLMQGGRLTESEARAKLRRLAPFDQHSDIIDEI